MSPDWPNDPLFDPNDPAAVEREERRREREAKRQQREAKKAGKEAPPPPPPKPEEPPKPPRTPEQEFWDEDPVPTPPPSGQELAASPPSQSPDPGMAERGRRRLFRKRRSDPAPEPPKTPAPDPRAAPPATPSSSSEPPAAARKAPVPPPVAAAGSPAAVPPKGETPAEPASPPLPKQPAAPPGPKPAATGKPMAPTGEQAKLAPKAPAADKPAPTAEPEPTSAPKPPSPDKPVVAKEDLPPRPDAKPAPIPIEEDASPPSGDPLAGAAAAAAGSARAEAASASAGPAANGASGDLAAAPSTREFAAPPGPPEETNTGDWQPLPERDWDFADEGDPEMAGAARHGRRLGEGGRRGGKGPLGSLLRHPFRILALIVLLLILWFLNSLFQPFHGDGHGRVAVAIPKGSGVGEVGDILEKRGVIDGSAFGLVDASTLFQIRVTLEGKRGDLHAGHFKLQEGMSYDSAISALSKEPTATKPGITTVTIPEGLSRPRAATLIKEDGVPGNYVRATKKSKLLNPAKYGGKGAKTLEGFLFPDTFELRPNAPVKDLVQLQLEDFKRKIKKVNMKYARSKNLTTFDVLTIASMVEGEAGVPKQRKLVASVVYNRLHEGMTLGLDTTIRFATGNYDNPLTEKQLETSSPYNTRTNVGLPPGPIDSPGLAAIQAAAHPAKTQFLFYVNNPNSCGELTFSKTEEEFEADVQKYENAREKAGGNAPSTCGE